MEIAFYLAGAIAVIATVLAVTNTNPVHALLYLIASLLAVAMVFFAIGAPFAGILEIIVYAGAIMVLFVFVVMMLNLGRAAIEQEKRWLRPGVWIGPTVLWAALLIELMHVLWPLGFNQPVGQAVGARVVGIALFGPYLLAVELASMLLLAALVAAFHMGRHD
ncbi:MAG: NADH-quinone oxidoreductase subunit J [Nevskia sp.]|nr:NADH-quinone oxidoreductase subunit J [Nevskia sp.]